MLALCRKIRFRRDLNPKFDISNAAGLNESASRNIISRISRPWFSTASAKIRMNY